MKNEKTLSALAEIASKTIMTACVEYLRGHNHPMNPDQIVKACRMSAHAAVPQALQDAREAFDCHMDTIGQATFLASMKLAGINAAKQIAA